MAHVAVLGGGQLGLDARAGRDPARLLVHVPRSGRGRARRPRSASSSSAPRRRRRRAPNVAAGAAVVTYEWEGVPAATGAGPRSRTSPVYPAARAPSTSRRTGSSRSRRCNALGIATAPFRAVDSTADLRRRGRRDRAARGVEDAARRLRRQGSGRAARAPPTSTPPGRALGAGAAASSRASCRSDRELSILAVRGRDGEVACWPVVENHHRDGILRLTRAPAPGLDDALQARAEAAIRPLLEDARLRRRVLRRAVRRRRRRCSPTRSRRACTTPGTGRSRARRRASSRTTCARSSACRSARPRRAASSAMVNCIGEMPDRDAILADPGRAPPRLRQGSPARPQGRARHRDRAPTPAELEAAPRAGCSSLCDGAGLP